MTRSLSASRVVLTALAVAGLVFLPFGADAAQLNPKIDRGSTNDGGIELRDKAVDDDGNFRRTPMYARANYQWPFTAGPFYGRVDQSEFREPGVLHTQVGSFRLSSQLDLPAELRASSELASGKLAYYVIQAHPEQATALLELRSTIESMGGAVVDHLPVSAMVARVDSTMLATIDGTPGVIAIEPYHPAFKLNPLIGRTPLADPVKAMSEVYELEVILQPGETAEAVASALASLGGKVNHVYPDTVIVEIHRQRLVDVARIEAVKSIVEHIPARPHGEETTSTMQVGSWSQGATPYHDAGIDGGGGGAVNAQVVMVLDSGISIDAGDLSDTMVNAGTTGPAHRKVRLYASTGGFGGQGDLLGCDAPQQGGFTHGHVVAATALGNATNVDTMQYGGSGFVGSDTQGNPWALDGVAPGAVLVAYDGQITPQSVSCADPLQDTISPGDLYSGAATGSLGSSYTTNGARTFNFSWGANANLYNTNAVDVDNFLNDKGDALVFISAGNDGQDTDNDTVPDPGSLGAPATAKNALAIGASRNANDPGAAPEFRATFSSVGPAIDNVVNRVAPQLMAPGDELGGGTLGLASEFSCRSSDNDQSNPVQCDLVTGVEGTSFSAPASAGTAALVRDYFAQGFYPTGAAVVADQVATVSGALVKSVLITSADFMSGFAQNGLTRRYRWNNEQGYGRIQLDNALPLETWPPSPSGLAVADGGIAGGVIDLGLAGTIDAVAGATQTATFEVCSDAEELRVALSWFEASGAALTNNLNLRIISPAGPGQKTYRGNYFTDDNNKDGDLDVGEDCPGLDGTTGTLDEEQWTLAQCANTPFDTQNPTEAIFLTPDFDGDGIEMPGDPTPADDSQIVPGTWTVEISAAPGGSNNNQRYALAIAGGVCLGSSVRFDQGTYTCNSVAKVTVNELAEGGDLNPTEAQVSSRTTVEVLDGNGMVVDSEAGLTFTKPNPNALRFESEDIVLSAQTARQSNNGVLDVQTGDGLRVTYVDTTATRRSFATVNCVLNIGPGEITFAQFGMDDNVLILGGCERNARGLFEFGFPDRYMDADEELAYRFAFNSAENFDLDNVVVNLRCVHPDGDSPEDCLPTSTDCADPRRENNTTCDGSTDDGHTAGTQYMTIIETPKRIGFLPAGNAVAESFGVRMVDPIAGTPEVEMVLEVTAATSGKSSKGVAVNRHRLDVDEQSIYYSTDFPTGGTAVVVVDRNNNEIAQGTYPPPTGGQLGGTPTTNIGDFLEDYRFETKSYGNLMAGGKNPAIQAPWHFDNGPNGFTNGIGAVTDESTVTDIIAQWGEDKNFNGVNDGVCRLNAQIPCTPPTDTVCQVQTGNSQCNSVEDRDTLNAVLDTNWSTRGGCGWQTRAPASCSLNSARGCHINSDCLGRCRNAANNNSSSSIACMDNTPCLPGETCQGFAGVCSGAPGPNQSRGGTWHTGRIDVPTLATCMGSGATSAQCQRFEVISGGDGVKTWFELLVTPEMQKVNGDDYFVEIIDWGWNQSIDLPDNNVAYTWEFDTDTEELEPVDIKSDLTLLNFGFGEFGAVTAAGNPDLADGFSVFAPLARCNVSLDPCKDTALNTDCAAGTCSITATSCHSNLDCPATGTCNVGGAPCNVNADCGANGPCNGGQTCAGFDDCVFTGVTINGNDANGNNRVGDNSCFFEGGAIPAGGQGDLGLTGPADDDRDQDGDLTFDDFVEINGPHRNMDIYDWNGPDMRFSTLEDIFGPTGNRFQGAIGFLNFETDDAGGNPTTPGFGLTVDDVVVEWREFTLVEDTVTCIGAEGTGGGACAAMDVDQINVFEGRSALQITALENNPYGAPDRCSFDSNDPDSLPDTCGVSGAACTDNDDCQGLALRATDNDCNNNGSWQDGIDDTDCDDNGAQDLVVVVTSTAELSANGVGEIVALNRQGATNIYEGEIPVSTALDSKGVLFIQVLGSDAPTVTVTYDDWDDGAGNICQNDVDPASQGEVQVSTTFFVTTGSLSVVNAVLTDNNDNDGFADPNETVDMRINVQNLSLTTEVRGLVAQLASNDPKIDCILDSFIEVGDIAGGAQVLSPEAFRFRVANQHRVNANDLFAATFAITLSSDDFDSVASPIALTIDLDLNASGGSGPTSFNESFEGGTLGAFTNQNLDQNLFSFPASDGYRCQYSDPDWPFSNSYGAIDDCIVGPSQAANDAVWWNNNNSRGFTGTQSLYYGTFINPDLGFTTPLGILDAVRLTNPVNLSAAAGVVSELRFKHQTSLMDSRTINSQPFRSADRIVSSLQLADGAGTGIGDWIRLEPYYNAYDTQAEDNYFNCFFDPIDDGNTEDDFFDPSDPQRRLGPSSTCFPVFSFVFQGSTVGSFSPSNVGRATLGPGLQGQTGDGTWVESRIDLSRFRGRRVRVRWLGTAIKVGPSETYEAIFQHNPDPGDDGMWIDDVQISNTLTSPATISVDGSAFAGTPCGTICDFVTPDLVIDPTSLAAPGQAVELDASGSVANKCLDGALQFRFGTDDDGDGSLDTVIRTWTDNPVLVDAPTETTDYVLEVRCSTDPTCSASLNETAVVACPGAIGTLFCRKTPTTTCFYDPGAGGAETDFAKGSFRSGACTALHPVGCTSLAYSNWVESTLVPAGTPYNHGVDNPAAGLAFGYLVKLDGNPLAEAAFCNSPDWGNGSPQCAGCGTDPTDRNQQLGDP